ncbi:MAG TPA: DNA repair protein RecO [bacterium]|nr:DNA repair protein RecO [bacterium]
MCTFSIDGVILRIVLGSEFDARLTVLTRRFGRLSLVARRLNRPSGLRGSIDALSISHCYVRRMGKSGMLRLEECERELSFPELAADYVRFVCASYVAEFLLLAVPEESPCPELYDLLLQALDCLRNCVGSVAVALAAELKMLDAMGLAPSLSQCVHCGRAAEAKRARYVVEAGGMVCSDCWSRRKADYEMSSPTALSPGVLAFAKRAILSPISSLKRTRISRPLARELLHLSARHKAYHLQLELNSARLLRASVRLH